MNKIAILSVVAALATVYFLSTSSTSTVLESQFQSFLFEYGRSYNSQSEYEFRIQVLKKNIENAIISWRFPYSRIKFCLELMENLKMIYELWNSKEEWPGRYYCPAGSALPTQNQSPWFETTGNHFIIYLIGY